jgi:hypothetical protein
MRARADVLGGELAVMDVIPHGLCIRLVLPGEELAPGAPEPDAASTL